MVLGRFYQLLQPGLRLRIDQRSKIGPRYNLKKLLFRSQQISAGRPDARPRAPPSPVLMFV
jgi:hypothetical protein